MYNDLSWSKYVLTRLGSALAFRDWYLQTSYTAYFMSLDLKCLLCDISRFHYQYMLHSFVQIICYALTRTPIILWAGIANLCINWACWQHPHYAILYWNTQQYSVKIYHWLSVSGNSEIMHCGILINMPYEEHQAAGSCVLCVAWNSSWRWQEVSSMQLITPRSAHQDILNMCTQMTFKPATFA